MILKRDYFLPSDEGRHLFAISTNNGYCYVMNVNGSIAKASLESEYFKKDYRRITDYELLFSDDVKRTLLDNIRMFVALKDLSYLKSLRNDLKEDIETLIEKLKEGELR